MTKHPAQTSQRAKQLHTIDLAQHNSRVQVMLAHILQNLGLYLQPTTTGVKSPIVIHARSEKGVDILVRRRKGDATCVHIEVESKKGGQHEPLIERWLRRPEIQSRDACALIIVHADPGWWLKALATVRERLRKKGLIFDTPVHCVALEDYGHLVPMLVCHYLLPARIAAVNTPAVSAPMAT